MPSICTLPFSLNQTQEPCITISSVHDQHVVQKRMPLYFLLGRSSLFPPTAVQPPACASHLPWRCTVTYLRSTDPWNLFYGPSCWSPDIPPTGALILPAGPGPDPTCRTWLLDSCEVLVTSSFFPASDFGHICTLALLPLELPQGSHFFFTCHLF